MGLFKRNSQEPPGGRPSIADRRALAQQMQAQAMQQMAALERATAGGSGGGSAAQVGSGTWVRQVMAIVAPPEPGFVKRCSCVVCGAPKKLPTVTAYVYCDFCASLIDYDLRRACEGDTTPGPAYAATVNSARAASQEAIAAGDRDTYRDLQKKVYEAYMHTCRWPSRTGQRTTRATGGPTWTT